jgi:hypothetical protein
MPLPMRLVYGPDTEVVWEECRQPRTWFTYDAQTLT